MNGKDQYSGLDLRTRKMLLGSFRVFFRHIPVRYHTFAYATKEFTSLEKLAGTMRRDLVNFLFDNLAQLQAYDAVKVYYDNGQHSIAESLHLAIEYALSKDAVVYRSAQPSEYRLSQAADYICTMELTAIKYAEHTARGARGFPSATAPSSRAALVTPTAAARTREGCPRSATSTRSCASSRSARRATSRCATSATSRGRSASSTGRAT